MGTYYKIINLDKKEYLDPSCFNQSPKIIPLAISPGISTALIMLLYSDWGGDRIDILSDNNDLYFNLKNEYKNISHRIISGVKEWTREDIPDYLKENIKKCICGYVNE